MRASVKCSASDPVPALFAQTISFCVHTCVCVCERQAQEKQARLLILQRATSRLQRGWKQQCPTQGPANVGIVSRGHNSQKSHPLLPHSAHLKHCIHMRFGWHRAVLHSTSPGG